MGEDVARAVGAGTTLTVEIGGKQCTVRPIDIRGLAEVERDCLSRYKRQYVESLATNLDLLPAEKRDKILESRLDAASRWDLDDLPPKFVHDPQRIKLTDAVKKWLSQNMGATPDATDAQLSRLVAAALDQELLQADVYHTMADGHEPPRQKVPYVNWWVTGSFDGMITFVWSCFRRDGVTRDQVLESLGSDLAKLVEVSREIERLSVPSVGNG